MASTARVLTTVGRGAAWLVLALMLAAGLYAAWIVILNYHRIQV